MVRKVVLFISLLAIQLALAEYKLTDIPRKNLAGPPSEFPDHEIPSPLHGALSEDSSYMEFTMTPKKAKKENTKMIFKTALMVDSNEEFTFSVFSKVEGIELELTDPNGKDVELKGHAIKGNFPIGSHELPETTYRFEYPVVGIYQLEISTEEKLSSAERLQMTATAPHGAIILWNKSKVRAFSHLNTYDLTLNSKIGLLTAITGDDKIVAGVRPTAMKDVISEAELDVILPDGSEVDVQMHDDGLHDDLEANDGVYGATIPASEAGTYMATAYITGVDANGVAFERSTQHLIPVVVDFVNFVGTATGSLTDKEHMNIDIQVTTQGDVSQSLFRAYAQVWGTDANGNQVAACWIGGMVPVQQQSSGAFVSLELDLNWLALAQVSTPITLKQVVVQETANYIPVAQLDSISVQTSQTVEKFVSGFIASTKVTEISKEMRVGRRTRPTMAARNATVADGKLLLLHGYCSSTNPWSTSDFTQAAFFLEKDANMNNEQFATKVFNWAETNGFPSYGIVGHSQGGMVALHLLNYFETGLDDASGGQDKVIQSVGTPYQGCSAAGSAANLGKLFGAGCGANTDLTTDGAKLWLAGIATHAKSEVHYYTTTYEQGNFFGDWCNLAMNAVLEWPNDGTTEIDHAHCPGGKNMGNTEKQCHTTGMGYMAQYLDSNRNRQMNSAAAR